jgi:hypothetical protein
MAGTVSRYGIGAFALGTVLLGLVGMSGIGYAQDPGPSGGGGRFGQGPPPQGGGGFGGAGGGGRGGFGGQMGPMMGASAMAVDAGYVYVLRGNMVFRISTSDMKISGQVELPMPPPPPGGPGGPGGSGGPGGRGGGEGGRGGGEGGRGGGGGGVDDFVGGGGGN